jgi:hypothetical protein
MPDGMRGVGLEMIPNTRPILISVCSSIVQDMWYKEEEEWISEWEVDKKAHVKFCLMADYYANRPDIGVDAAKWDAEVNFNHQHLAIALEALASCGRIEKRESKAGLKYRWLPDDYDIFGDGTAEN